MIREKHPKIGGRKLHFILQKQLANMGVRLGRDYIFGVLRSNNLLIKKRRKPTITTNSKHWFRKYPNLIKEIQLTCANQLWVSDITYIPTKLGFSYLSIITDAYSRKIVGYQIANNLESVNTQKALKMAIEQSNNTLEGLIHHSDRGVQYCTTEYIKILQEHNIRISMTQNGDPIENAIAERVNGILKNEYLEQMPNLNQEELDKIVKLYNNERPHLSCGMLTPKQAHIKSGPIKRAWKAYYRKSQ